MGSRHFCAQPIPKEGRKVKSKTVWLIGCVVVWGLSVTAALAEGGKQVAEADRTAACAREAKGLKGEDHERAVSECLKGPERGTHSQQNKMKYCNVEAGRKELHGDERRAFMSSCLKG
jgi:hypothetical protein